MWRVLLEQAAGDPRGHDGVAPGHRPDGRGQLGRRHVLEQEAAGAGPEGPEGVLVEIEGGQDEHPGVPGGLRFGDGPSGRDPVEHGHAHVHEDDVGAVELGQAHGVGAVGRLAHDLHVLLGLEDHAEPLAQQGLVVGQDDPDRHGEVEALQSRSVAVTSQPPAARGAARREPPKAAARSAMPARP